MERSLLSSFQADGWLRVDDGFVRAAPADPGRLWLRLAGTIQDDPSCLDCGAPLHPALAGGGECVCCGLIQP